MYPLYYLPRLLVLHHLARISPDAYSLQKALNFFQFFIIGRFLNFSSVYQYNRVLPTGSIFLSFLFLKVYTYFV